MTADEKMAAILAAIQTDPGNRGLAELFTACPDDFAAACRSIADQPNPSVAVVTGFFIPSADPPHCETDGPLGAVFLARLLAGPKTSTWIVADAKVEGALEAGLDYVGVFAESHEISTAYLDGPPDNIDWVKEVVFPAYGVGPSHLIGLERVGPNHVGRCYNMRGRDVTEFSGSSHELFELATTLKPSITTIGIGDGGNEIGMGKIPHETIVKNIPNGDLIHCRVATDHLIVAGVSNWGAYALAAGIYVLRGVKPPPDLFDPDRERAILEVMVKEGPLVDGVTGKQTATVDGLTWDEYVKPLIRIGEILAR